MLPRLSHQGDAASSREKSVVPRPKSLSFDLLQTFVLLIQNDGDAAKTARELGINQASMSKRLRYLQLNGPVLDRPWLERKGKTWHLTEEGKRVKPAVHDMIDRFTNLSIFLEEPKADMPKVKFACGRQSAVGFVHRAVRLFQRQHDRMRLLISTMRGAQRIQGVASGALDLATVTHSADSIEKIGRRELHVETLTSERLALVCSIKSQWASLVEKLPKFKTPLKALGMFPLILPEADAGIRRHLDAAVAEAELTRQLDVRLEMGGWSAILAYVRDGMGVGVVSEGAAHDARDVIVRCIDAAVLAPTETKIVCRHDFETPGKLDLSPQAEAFYHALKEAAKR